MSRLRGVPFSRNPVFQPQSAGSVNTLRPGRIWTNRPRQSPGLNGGMDHFRVDHPVGTSRMLPSGALEFGSEFGA